VVEAPAKRYGVTVDSKLVDALVENAPKDDTLPILAFALQRLWRQFAAMAVGSGGLAQITKCDPISGLNDLTSKPNLLRPVEPGNTASRFRLPTIRTPLPVTGSLTEDLPCPLISAI
jgi:hypothetical protein